MKKIISLILSFVFICFGVFAEKSYTVSAVAGEVSYRLNDGKWAPLKVGMNLSDTTKVTTGLNSTLIIASDDNSVVVLPLKTGSVEDVIAFSKDKSLIKLTRY